MPCGWGSLKNKMSQKWYRSMYAMEIATMMSEYYPLINVTKTYLNGLVGFEVSDAYIIQQDFIASQNWLLPANDDPALRMVR